MTLRELRAKVYNVARDARNLNRLVEGMAFQRAWEGSTEEQRRELESYVVGIDKEKVDKWVKRILANTNLEDKGIKELREIAKAAGVSYYHSKMKDELIEELKNELG